MKASRLAILMILLPALVQCGGEPAVDPANEAMESSEQQYELRGVVVERDPIANTLRIRHGAIGDWMGPMTMTFPVRGADVASLAEQGESITGTVHVRGTDFWLSDVKVTRESAESAPVE